ncbi:hypothetical protein MAR_025449 [Mya arenaria]|uniref:Uncharacterized protein n=1 Tax=Mya arenaria TaxID=6604 RepID=A0ABY7DWU3_MYAAR|nr:hypothetical protein MAR_025449 [Mya arenaria]
MDGDPPGKELPGNDLSGSKDADGGDGVGAGLPSSIEDAPKEIEPEALTAETELDRFVEGEFKQQDDTFITEVRMVDDSGRGEGVGRRRLTKEDEDLGIYDDTDDGDDLSDSELELERLREEKRKREEEERQEEEHRKEAERKAALEERLRMEREQERELAMKAKTPPDTTIAIFEKPEITPRPDAGASSRTSARSWSDPKFLQGLSLKEIYWRSGGPDQPTVTTSMASQIEHSMRRKCDTVGRDNIEMVLLTPPARENTQTDIFTGRSNTSTDGNIESVINEVNYHTGEPFLLNVDIFKKREIKPGVGIAFHTPGKSFGDCASAEGLLALHDDPEISEDLQVEREMERLLMGGSTEPLDSEEEVAVDEQLRCLEVARSEVDDRFSRASRDTFTTTLRTGLSTRTIPELNLSWDSTAVSSTSRSGVLSAYTNQYLHNTASIFGSTGGQKKTRQGQRRRAMLGVRWDSRIEDGGGIRKLFSFECSTRKPDTGLSDRCFESSRFVSVSAFI